MRWIPWRGGLTAAAALMIGCGARSGLSLPSGSIDLGSSSSATTSSASSTSSSGSGGSGGSPVTKAVSVSAASAHACAVTREGTVRCWGFNSNGQLGNDSIANSSVPVEVEGLEGAASVSAGGGHTCAVTKDGAAKCWGWNEFGQLGDGTTTDRHVPADVVGLSEGVVSIATGSGYSCAVLFGGELRCWGRTISPGDVVPIVVPGLSSSGVSSVSVGFANGDEQACVLTDSGAVKCWGSNYDGQLGNGSNTNSNVPVDVKGLSSGIVSVSAANGYSCAVRADGFVFCWGGDYGEFATGLYGGSNVPVVVIPGFSSPMLAISAGDVQACALTKAGGAVCWGSNNHGQLGDGTTIDSHAPKDVVGLSSGVVAVTAGAGHSCALLTEGHVKCWGSNSEGELGDGSLIESPLPVDVAGF